MKNYFTVSSIKPPGKGTGIIMAPVILQTAFFFLLSAINASSQSKWAFEQYNYIQQKEPTEFVPIIRFETKNNWHFETRYNYEDAQTISLFAGKTFTGGKDFEYTLTPMTGFSGGRFTGLSIAANTEATWKKFYVWAQSQYSKATKKNTTDFFFNWSELGYNVSDHFFTGLAMQYTRQAGGNSFEPGATAGLSFKNISFPFYLFNPFRSDSYLVLGVNYEYTIKKKR